MSITYTALVYNTATKRDETVIKVSSGTPEDFVAGLEEAGDLVYSLWIQGTCVFQSAMQSSDVNHMLDMYV